MLKLKQLLIAIGLVVVLTVTVVGCAKQQFVKQQFTAAVPVAAGQRYLPAKIDILLVPDNTGSTSVAISQIQSELSSFVSGLQGQYWDYHVARSPIAYNSAFFPINQVLVNSQFNTTTNSDGTLNNSNGIVPSNIAVTDPNAFTLVDPVLGYGNGDYTYINTYNTLNHAHGDTTTNFLRPDAPLAIVVVTNGYDATVTNWDGSYVAGGQQNLSKYANQLIALKGSSSMLRFYPVAAYKYNIGQGAHTCLMASGGQSFIGTGYFNMNQFLGGLPYAPDSNGTGPTDFCNSSSLANVFTDITANLQVLRQEYVYSALVLDKEPVINGDFQVTKNGNALAQDPSNGWEYLGYKANYCTVTSVINSNTQAISPINPCLFQQSGYVVQLNGSAQMWGGDVPNVTTDHP